jgi:tetratricopeptide (TPR) repeat protein
MKGVISVTLGWTFFCLGNDALAHQFLEDGICDLKSGRGTENSIKNQETTHQKNIDTLIPALSHVEKQKYSEDIHIVRATSYLGIVALRGGQLEKSKKILEWCKPIYQLSFDYVGYTRVLTFLGHLYTLLNDYQKSEKYFLDSIAFCRKHNVRKANLARALAFLGFLYREEGKFEQAKTVLSESANLYKEGILHVWAIAHKAGIETELGHYEIAKKMLENTIRVYKEKKAAQHVSLGWIYPYLGSIYRKIGNYKEALDLFIEGICVYKNAESSISINLGTPFPLVHLGKLYRKMGLYDLAYKYLSEAKQEHLKIFGENNARTLWNDMALADLYIDLHKYNEAKKLIEKCLLYYKKTLLPTHPKIGKALSSLATTYSKLGDTQQADPLFKQALEILETHYGPNHIETTPTLIHYGDHLIKTNHLDKAHHYLTKANNILLTHHHPDVYLSLVKRSALYTQQAKTGKEPTKTKIKQR